MTRLWSDGSGLSEDYSHHVIARKERSEGRGNPLHAMVAYRECGSLPSSQWIATGFRPRDDKVGSEAVDGWRTTRMLSLRGENKVRDAAIHRVPGEANGFVCWRTGSQWIATGSALAMTRLWSDTR